VAPDEVSTKANQTIGTKKVMLTVIWGIDGFHIVDTMPPKEYFNTEDFLPQIMDLLPAKVFPKGRKSHTLR
jgi:hypothetical protein